MRRTIFWVMAVLGTVLLPTAHSAQHRSKKLVEFGWDEPDTAFMRQHIRDDD